MNNTTPVRSGEVKYSDYTRTYLVHQDDTGHVTATFIGFYHGRNYTAYTPAGLVTYVIEGLTIKAPSRGLAMDLWTEVH